MVPERAKIKLSCGGTRSHLSQWLIRNNIESAYLAVHRQGDTAAGDKPVSLEWVSCELKIRPFNRRAPGMINFDRII